MLASFLITFRESLEAALVIGIILAYLTRTNRQKYNNIVYLGIVSSVVASFIAALLFQFLAGGFTGRAEEIFEGISMFVAAILITFMILWMMKQRHVAKAIEARVEKDMTKYQKFGLFFVTFTAVLREGVETVIFLWAARFVDDTNSVAGAFLGVIFAIILGYFVFTGSKKLHIKTFFKVTSILLILFSAGLIAHGIHEFEEANLLPPPQRPLFDINPNVNQDGSYPALHDKGSVGSVLKGLFGYNGDPSLFEVLGYVMYLIIILFLWRYVNRLYEKEGLKR